MIWLLLGTVALIGGLAYFRTPLWLASLALATLFAGLSYTGTISTLTASIVWIVFLAIALVLNISVIRRALISTPALAIFRRIMPPMSQTEREAIEAGTVWWDAELFSGRPRWRKLLNYPAPTLSDAEQAFLDGPVEELCRQLDDWDIAHEHEDLPPEIWQILKQQRFFGMIIPTEYGGLGFSALAHSTVVMKIASRSVATSVTVMVPNSLGPAELLLHYGTDEQKNHYLPRLARGDELPCFCLTGPEAGSDAGNMPDRGIVCRGEFEGKSDVLGIRVNWNKRYITLGPIATVLGVAFKLYDPDHLLGQTEDIGITCALIPADTPGITIGDRHNPLKVPFQNGPNQGKDVFIPVDWVIGGPERVGQGWRMLMESLAAGRSISLPSQSTGAAKLVSRATGAYARIRRQFGLPIGRFEGVEDVLGRIAGQTYTMDAARCLTASAVDTGAKPSVLSAIVKYHLTERMRQIVNDAMDIQGGSAICLGPRNYLSQAYQALPIAITVEGANILTRSLIIYGQGAIRCHPYVLKEMQATSDPDRKRAAKDFDRALFGHIGFVLSNFCRSLIFSLTGAWLVTTPRGPGRRYFQQLTRLSAAFALVSDVAMLVLGGGLKRKERLSARLGDVLSEMYLASCVLKRFEDDGRLAEDQVLLDWSCQQALHQAELSLRKVLDNFPLRPAAWLLKLLIFPFGTVFTAPSDRLNARVAQLILEPSPARDRLTRNIYISERHDEQLGRIEDALHKVIAAEPVERKLRDAVKRGVLQQYDDEAGLAQAVSKEIITPRESEIVHAANAARLGVIQVDAFAPEQFGRQHAAPASATVAQA